MGGIVGIIIVCFIAIFMIFVIFSTLGYVWDNFVLKYWYIILLLIILFFYGFGKMSEEEERRKKDFKVSLKKREIYEIIRNYTIKYSGELSQGIRIDDEFNKLVELLVSKGIDFSELDYKIVEDLIHEELNELNYNYFKSKILWNEPKTKQNYLRNYLDLYGGEEKDIEYFVTLLNEKFGDCDIELIIKELNELKKKIELKTFEERLTINDHVSLSIRDIDNLNGYEFEHFLKTLFENLGYIVENIQQSHDQGADLVVKKFGEKIIIQAKRYSQVVGNKAVQEVAAAVRHYRAERGMVVTTNRFTNSAIELARSNNVELVDRETLSEMINTAFR